MHEKYVLRNIAVRSRNHCCSGTAVIITYFECVFVAVGIHHEMRMRIICGLSGSTKFYTLSHKGKDFRKTGF
jgi:hypothetical protein